MVESGQDESTKARSVRGTFVVGVRLGTSLFAGGEHEVGCSSSVSGFCGAYSNVDVSDRSPLVIGVDGLVHATAGLRLGLSYWLIPYSGVRFDDSNDDTVVLGNAHRLLGVIEGLVPIGSTSKLTLRAQAGLGILVVGGDIEEQNSNYLDACNASTLDHCHVDGSPFFGSSYGVQVGYLATNKLRWRTDFALERFSQKIRGISVRDEGHTSSVDETSSGTRLIVSLGLEL